MMDHKVLQKSLRKKILEICHKVKSGHIACSLSCIDLIIAIMILYKKNNEDFILSKGHAAAALYVALNHTGVIDDGLLDTFYKNGTKLSAHPSPNSFNEIPFATGSLGHGFPQAVGIALSNKLKKNDLKTYVLLSDGETNEGTTWEAAHFSVVKELTNLIVIIDDNKLQGFGKTSEVLGDTSRISKFNEIGFDTFECSGHNISDILKVLRKIEKTSNNKPKLILANTVKGKGVSFMENKLEWHYLPINDELLSKSISDVENYTF
jgi:transketolase